MTINGLIKSTTSGSKCEIIVDNVFISNEIFQESEPYIIDKNIVGQNVYTWNPRFIDKVIESFATTIVQNFSKKEKDLFNRYTSFLINGIAGVLDEDVRELDTYIGTIKGDYIWIVYYIRIVL